MFSNPQERRKAAAIPILALILAWLLGNRFTDDGSPDTDAVLLPSATAEDFIRSRQQTAAALAELNTMSSVNLDTALKHDPFAVPPALLPEPDTTEDADEADLDADDTDDDTDLAARQAQDREQQRARLQKLQVTAVLTSGSQPSALLGRQVIRVGDTLPGGATVVSIDRQGVVVRLP